MKVTKFPQSCLLLEKGGRRIVIDPGRFFTEKYEVADLGKVEAVLYTHQHSDHFDPSLVEPFLADEVCLYGNAQVAKLIGQHATEVKDGVGFSIAGFDIMPHDLPHFKIDAELPQNTGYIIDGNFFHPGDGVETGGVHVHDYASPIAGGFSFDDILKAARSFEAKRLIPIHYSNHALYPVDVNEFAQAAGRDFEVIVLDDGESAEL